MAPKRAKFVSSLESQNQANKKSDKGKNRKGADTNIEGLRDRTLKAGLAYLGTEQPKV